MIYGKNTIYVLGTAKISKNDPITDMFSTFFIGIILNKESGIIVDSTCNMVRDVTTDFIRSILIDYNLIDDIDQIVYEIQTRFFGIAQKAIVASIKDARNKYLMIIKD